MTFSSLSPYNTLMEKRFSEDKIEYVYEGKALASVHFAKDKGQLLILSTFVDSSLRGQGVAGKLMQDVLFLAEKENLKIKSQCSYVTSYFLSHPTPYFEDR